MKKVIYNHYGNLDVLKLIDVAIPEPGSNQLLIKVKAVSMNPLDWKIMEGKMKMVAGSKFPKSIGIDFAGVVEKTGEGIRKLKPGDAVLGSVGPFKGGALAEYLLVSESSIALKPKNISFEQAAAMPTVGMAALQIFEQLAPLSTGTEVLINGASGGIGMFAIQLAKMKGAHVTSVASTKGLSWVKKWGSDVLVNYREQNILESGKQYDVVLDLSGKMPYRLAKKIMKPHSVYVNSIPGPKEIISAFIHNLFSKKKYKVLLLKQVQERLERLSSLAGAGMEIVVWTSFPLSSFKEAYAAASTGGMVGKGVISISSPTDDAISVSSRIAKPDRLNL